jgi:hypothetical protein
MNASVKAAIVVVARAFIERSERHQKIWHLRGVPESIFFIDDAAGLPECVAELPDSARRQNYGCTVLVISTI